MGDMDEIIRKICLMAPPFILSLSVHEWAHAWSAFKLGDPTAKMSGRMTFDPMAHGTLMGTVVIPLLSVSLGGFFFGWAKPVPVDTRYFKNPRAGMALVAAAGPFSNIIIALLLSIVIGQMYAGNYSLEGASALKRTGLEMLQFGVQINVALAVFNMLPLPPLDGSRILQGFMSREWADKMDQSAGMLQIVLFVVIFSPIGALILYPPMGFLIGLYRMLW